MKNNSKKQYGLIAIFGLLAVFCVYVLIVGGILPHYQAKNYLKYIFSGKADLILTDSFIFEDYPYVQFRLRSDFTRNVGGSTITGDTGIKLVDLAIDKLENWENAPINDPTYFVSLARAYEAKGNLLKDKSFIAKAGEFYQKAIDISPKRQELRYIYAGNLINQGKSDEAIQLLKEAVALAPEIPHSHFYLSIALLSRGESAYDEIFTNMEFVADSGLLPQFDQTTLKNIYGKFITYYYEKRDKDKLSQVAGRMVYIDPDQSELYKKLVDYIGQTGQIPDISFKEN